MSKQDSIVASMSRAAADYVIDMLAQDINECVSIIADVGNGTMEAGPTPQDKARHITELENMRDLAQEAFDALKKGTVE